MFEPLRTGSGESELVICRSETGPAGTTVTHGENSDVSLPSLVAVAVMNCPGATPNGRTTLMRPLQATPVTTLADPMGVFPSPEPDGSQVVFEKNSILKAAVGSLSSEPIIVVVAPLLVADVRTGKF